MQSSSCSEMWVDEHQTRSATRVCGFSTFIYLVYRNDYDVIRGHGGYSCQWSKVILAESEEQLQRLMNVVVAKSEEKLLHLNSAKSFSIVFFFKSTIIPTCHIDVYWNILEQVQPFIYLRSLFSSDTRYEKHIIMQIGMAKWTVTSMNTVLTSRNSDMAVWLRE